MKPKQIIYPIKYLTPFIFSIGKSYKESFVLKITKLLKLKNDLIPLGRARSGIFLLVKGSISKERVKVIMSPYTIPDVINMVIFAGGTPVFVDFLPKSTNIDVESLVDMLDEKTACVVVTHYHICQNEIIRINKLCKNKNIKLFEDCAISLGGSVEGRSVGELSDGGVFSFSSFKVLNYFWGGGLVINNRKSWSSSNLIVNSWNFLRNRDYFNRIPGTLKYDFLTKSMVFGFVFKILVLVQKFRDKSKVVGVDVSHIRIESNEIESTLLSRPSNAACYEWSGKIDKVKSNLMHRRKISNIYSEILGRYLVSSESKIDIIQGSCFVNYPIFVDNRNDVYRKILESGYHVGLSLYPNCHNHPKFKNILGISKNVEILAKSVITIPTHPGITEKYAKEMAVSILSIVSG